MGDSTNLIDAFDIVDRVHKVPELFDIFSKNGSRDRGRLVGGMKFSLNHGDFSFHTSKGIDNID